MTFDEVVEVVKRSSGARCCPEIRDEALFNVGVALSRHESWRPFVPYALNCATAGRLNAYRRMTRRHDLERALELGRSVAKNAVPRAELVNRLLARLSPVDREIVHLRYVDRWPMIKIAQRLGIKDVSKRLKRLESRLGRAWAVLFRD